MSREFCGIVFIGGGTSWAYADTKADAAIAAAKRAKSDWKSMFTFKKTEMFKVNIFDTANSDGWYADYRGVFDDTTKEPLPLVEVMEVTV